MRHARADRVPRREIAQMRSWRTAPISTSPCSSRRASSSATAPSASSALECKRLGIERALIVTDACMREQHRRGGARGEGAGRAPRPASTTASSPTPASRSSTRARALPRSAAATAWSPSAAAAPSTPPRAWPSCITEGGSIRDHQGIVAPVAPADAAHRRPDDGGHRQRGLAATSWSRITRAHEKMHFMDDRIIPDAAILDPSVTLGMPPMLTAATGHGRAHPRHRGATPRSTATRSPTGWRCRRSASSRATCRAPCRAATTRWRAGRC